MLSGIHLIIYSRNAEADKVFFKDILQLTHVDVGQGWLIFGLPPTELAVHPSETDDTHEIYLMCRNIQSFVRQMDKKKIPCSKIQDRGWGQLVQLTLPGGGQLGVYQPRHKSPKSMLRSGAKTSGRSVSSKSEVSKKRSQ